MRTLPLHFKDGKRYTVFEKGFKHFREGTFFIGGGEGGGWAGASEGRVLSNFFTNWEGSNLFYSQPEEGHGFFGKEKLLHVASILYIQTKLPVKINLNYLKVTKTLYIKKLSSPNHRRLKLTLRGKGVK